MNTTQLAGVGPHQFLHALWKQRVCWLVLWLLVTTAGLVAIWLIPPRYKAVATLAVEPAEPAADRPNEAELRAQLQLAYLRVVQRERLLELLRNNYPDLVARWQPNQAPHEVERVREKITMTTVPEGHSGRLSAVRISFQSSKAAPSATVVNRLAAALIREFDELSQASRGNPTVSNPRAALGRLSECQQALKEFEAAYGRDLADREKQLAAQVKALQSQLAASKASLDRLTEQRAKLAQAIESAQASAPAQPPAAVGAKNPDAVWSLRRKLSSLLAHYKESHPDVRRLREEIAQAEALAAAQSDGPEARAAAEFSSSNTRAALESLKQALAQNERQSREAAAGHARLGEALAWLESELSRLPALRRQQAALLRECAVAEDSYRGASVREASRPSAAPARLVLLEEALPPQRALSPNRRLLALVGALLALIPCAFVAAGRELGVGPILAVLGLPTPNGNGLPRKSVAAAAGASRSGAALRTG